MTNKPKVISIGFAVPEISYTQEEVFQALGYPAHFKRLFRESGIDKRYFCLDLNTIQRLTFQEQQEEYAKWAVQLSCEAIMKCLGGRSVQDIGCLTYGSCTGLMPGPSASHYIGAKFNMSPSVYHSNIIGQGCESGFPGLKRAADYVKSSGKMALVVNCELCDLTYFPEDKGMDVADDYSLLRANALFGDAAVACLVGYDSDWRHPTIIDTETYTDHAYLGDLGYRWQNGRLRAVISRRVPELAPLVVKPAVEAVLRRQWPNIADINWFVIHAAGNSVLDNIRDALGIPEDKTILSRETLRMFGNTSSTSVGITGKRLMAQDIHPGDYAMVLSIGPGMTGGCTLLQFRPGGKE